MGRRHRLRDFLPLLTLEHSLLWMMFSFLEETQEYSDTSVGMNFLRSCLRLIRKKTREGPFGGSLLAKSGTREVYFWEQFIFS